MSTEIRGLGESELEAHAELVYRSYKEYADSGERPFLGDPHWWLKSVRSDPYYEPDQTRVMVLDGQLVASVSNYTREMYVDGRRAKVSCIGSVCTHPHHRRKGLIKQVLAESIEWMQRHGFNWSFLFGREAVYGSSGWSLLTTFHLTADLRVRDEYGHSLNMRAADPGIDLAALARLYDQFNVKLSGPIVRSGAYWRQHLLVERLSQAVPTYNLLELEGRPVAYFWGHDANISEIAWVEAPLDVLAFLLRLWPGQPVKFHCYTTELIHHLRALSHMTGYDDYIAHPGGINLHEAYKGLWRYIGDPDHRFPEITDTASLKRLLRDREYIFWPTDGF